ncbi:MAG: ABC transporter ATP-binding protein [Actinobacteria bacterium]|nr:ABC transporter ATP-binding protein [Actinomycetota bacterium]
MTAPAALSLRDLRFSYEPGGPEVLRSLTLDIPPGTATAVLGPNGCGKTTLLHVVLGWLAPRGGEVVVAGRPQGEISPRRRGRLVALVPQTEHVPFDFSVLEYVLMGRTPHLGVLGMPGAQDHRIALETLESLGLDHLSRRPVPELSGGERQMVTLARALAQRTPILLLDEPTAHLDLSNKGRLLSTLRRLADEGTTVLFTTHDPEAAALAARFVVLMRGGEVLAAGTQEEVLEAGRLSLTYGVPVRVVEIAGRRVVLLDEAAG